jgi:hypothetical protein
LEKHHAHCRGKDEILNVIGENPQSLSLEKWRFNFILQGAAVSALMILLRTQLVPGMQMDAVPLVNAQEICPPGMAVISVDPENGHCSMGAAAYCCDNPSTVVIPPLPTTGPLAQVAAITNSFLKFQQCLDYDSGAPSLRRRNDVANFSCALFTGLQSELGEHATNNIDICSLLIPIFLFSRLPAPPLIQLVRDDFSRRMAAAGFPGISSETLQTILQNPNAGDTLENCNDVMCDLPQAAAFLADIAEAQDELCVCPVDEDSDIRSDAQPSLGELTK